VEDRQPRLALHASRVFDRRPFEFAPGESPSISARAGLRRTGSRCRGAMTRTATSSIETSARRRARRLRGRDRRAGPHRRRHLRRLYVTTRDLSVAATCGASTEATTCPRGQRETRHRRRDARRIAVDVLNHRVIWADASAGKIFAIDTSVSWRSSAASAPGRPAEAVGRRHRHRRRRRRHPERRRQLPGQRQTPDQADSDGDGVGNLCDDCPDHGDSEQATRTTTGRATPARLPEAQRRRLAVGLFVLAASSTSSRPSHAPCAAPSGTGRRARGPARGARRPRGRPSRPPAPRRCRIATAPGRRRPC
jgi:hypothetical protein